MAQKSKPIVIDNGSWMCRAGYAGDSHPRCSFRSVVNPQKTLIGEDALNSPDSNLVYPVERGIVTNWECMESLWSHLFENELKVDPKDRPVLITDPPLNPATNRETSAQIMFEKFGVPSYFPATQAVLGLYATGNKSGVMVDSGFGLTRVVPVNDGFAVKEAIQEMNVGGKQVTEVLENALKASGKPFQDTAGTPVSDLLKGKLGYVALDYDKELAESKQKGDKEFDLPDGSKIQLGCERFSCAETMFNPSTSGYGGEGLHKVVNNAILKCSEDIRETLYNTIAVCGGNSLVSGFPERLKKEMDTLAPNQSDIRVIAAPERGYTVWIGGSILASLPAMSDMWITKAEYQEHGASILHKKAA